MEEYPETKPIFARVNGHDAKSPEFAAHCYRIMNAFDVLINLLYDTPALEKMASHLAEQHARRSGLKRERFAVSRTEGPISIYMFYLLHSSTSRL